MAMLRVSCVLPVFLMKMVTVVWPPGARFPQVTADMGVVKAASL